MLFRSLILVGKGGLYKTSFFQYLLPPELRQYYANDSTADYNNKDFLELCASKALICLDEFETPMGKNLSAFKSIVTKPTITLRRPYARYSSQLLHNASLCGTSNNIHIVELRTGKDNLLMAKQNELQAKYLTILNVNMLKFYRDGRL